MAKKTVTVRLLRSVIVNGQPGVVGEQYDVQAGDAAYLVGRKMAEPVGADLETAAVTPKAERAARSGKAE